MITSIYCKFTAECASKIILKIGVKNQSIFDKVIEIWNMLAQSIFMEQQVNRCNK